MPPMGRLRCSVPFTPPIRVSGASGGRGCVLRCGECSFRKSLWCLHEGRVRRSADGYRLFALMVGIGNFEALPSNVCMVVRGTYASPCVFELRRNLYFCPLEMYGARRWKEGKRVRL